MHHPVVHPNVPKTKGPYSQVTRLDQLLFVSGQASTDPTTGDVIAGSFDVQTRQAFENPSAALRAAGSGLEHVVKTTSGPAAAGRRLSRLRLSALHVFV